MASRRRLNRRAFFSWEVDLLRQGYTAQVASYHPQAQPAFHPVLPVIGAFAPAKVPSQARNTALDARAPAIAPAPGARALQGLAFRRELARGRDGHTLDSGCLQALLRLSGLYASVARHQTRRMVKERLVVRHRLHGLSMFGGMREDLLARHNPALHFVEHDLAAKFDQRAAFVAGNGPRMGLEEAEHLLPRGHLLALQHAGACLGDHALDQR